MRLRITAVVAVLALLALPVNAAAARYVVQPGDTLTWIAEAHGTTLLRLARANHRDPYATLVTGTVLRVPGRTRHRAAGRTHPYVVQWGDTLTFIAARAHTTVARLARLNGMSSTATLFAGSTLRIPGGRGRAPAPRHAVRRPGAGVGWRGHYRVRAGDTLSGIAARHGIGVRRLARANHRRVRALLLVGTRLRVPVRGSGPAPALAQPWSVGWSIDHWSAHYGVDVHLVRAVAWQESGWNPGVTSSAGAWGAMQVIPSTWSYVERSLIGHGVAHTPDGDVRVGVAYLHHLLAVFGGDEALAVTAYYQGERATRRFGILRVSRPYVANVMALRTRM